MTGRSYAQLAVALAGLVAAVAAGRAGWSLGGPHGAEFTPDPRVRRSIDATTALEVVAIDTDGDLVFDTWNYLDNGRLIRIEFDDDQDGRMDRRRWFNADGTIQRTESLADTPAVQTP